jgi:hypothetical protein
MDLREVGWGAQTGLIWLRIGTGGGLLCRRDWLEIELLLGNGPRTRRCKAIGIDKQE